MWRDSEVYRRQSAKVALRQVSRSPLQGAFRGCHTTCWLIGLTLTADSVGQEN